MAPQGAEESKGSCKRQVFLVDDHSSVRFSLRMLVNLAGDMRVCGEAEDAQPALEAIDRLHPDIAIVDIALERSHGLDLIRDLHIRHPKLPILVHSAHSEELYAPLSFHAGARGYMNKGQDVEVVIQAIRTMLNGNIYLSAEMLQWFTNCAMMHETVEPRHPLKVLSPRELQVFEMLGQGRDIKEIASQLSIDHKTVEMHRQRIKAKIGVKTAPEVLRAAVLWSHSSPAIPDLVFS